MGIQVLGTDGYRYLVSTKPLFPKNVQPVEKTSTNPNPKKEHMPYNNKGKRVKVSKRTLDILI
jgi:hypothetical protein